MEELDINKLTPEQIAYLRKALGTAKVAPVAAPTATGLLTPAQLGSISKMGDIGGDTEALQRQMDVSEQLRRQVTGIQGGGIGGNLGRAGYGVASAIKDYRANQLADELRKKRLAVNPMAGYGETGDSGLGE